jgi:hypothetical protein
MIGPQPTVDVLSDEEFESEILADAADIHARMARLAGKLVVFDERGLWRRMAMRNCEDWVTCRLGFDRPQARSLMLAGHAARELPELGEAFAAGELSVDKMRLLAPVVEPEDQGGGSGWLASRRLPSWHGGAVRSGADGRPGRSASAPSGRSGVCTPGTTS